MKIIYITNESFINKIKKIIAEKDHVRQKIREGKYQK